MADAWGPSPDSVAGVGCGYLLALTQVQIRFLWPRNTVLCYRSRWCQDHFLPFPRHSHGFGADCETAGDRSFLGSDAISLLDGLLTSHYTRASTQWKKEVGCVYFSSGGTGFPKLLGAHSVLTLLLGAPLSAEAPGRVDSKIKILLGRSTSLAFSKGFTAQRGTSKARLSGLHSTETCGVSEPAPPYLTCPQNLLSLSSWHRLRCGRRGCDRGHCIRGRGPAGQQGGCGAGSLQPGERLPLAGWMPGLT
nr:uncharacterized protein LOC104653295 [Saimiri boliviensis boliviensis]